MSSDLYNLIFGNSSDGDDESNKDVIVNNEEKSNPETQSTNGSQSSVVDDDSHYQAVKKEKSVVKNELYDFYFPKKEEDEEGTSNDNHNDNENDNIKVKEETDEEEYYEKKTEKIKKEENNEEGFDFEQNAREREFFSVESLSHKDIRQTKKKTLEKTRKKRRPKKQRTYEEVSEDLHRQHLRSMFRKKKYNFENEKDYGNAILHQIKSSASMIQDISNFVEPKNNNPKTKSSTMNEKEELQMNSLDFKKRGHIAPSSNRDVNLHKSPLKVHNQHHKSRYDCTPKNYDSNDKTKHTSYQKFFHPLKDQRADYHLNNKTCEKLATIALGKSNKRKLNELTNSYEPHDVTYYFPKSLFQDFASHRQHLLDQATGTIYPTKPLLHHHNQLSDFHFNNNTSYTTEEHINYLQTLTARLIFAKSFSSFRHYHQEAKNLNSEGFGHHIPSSKKRQNTTMPLHRMLSILYKKDHRFNYNRYFFMCAKEMASNKFLYSLIQAPMNILLQYHENLGDSPPIKSWNQSLKDSIHIFLLSDSFHQNWVMHLFNTFSHDPVRLRNYVERERKHLIRKTRESIHQLLELSSQNRANFHCSKKQQQDTSYIIHYLRSNMKKEHFNLFFSTSQLEKWKTFDGAENIEAQECTSNPKTLLSTPSLNQDSNLQPVQTRHQSDPNNSMEGMKAELTLQNKTRIDSIHDQCDVITNSNNNNTREDKEEVKDETSNFFDTTMNVLKSQLKLSKIEKRQRMKEKKESEWIEENNKVREKRVLDREMFNQQREAKRRKKLEENLSCKRLLLYFSEKGKDIYNAVDVYDDGKNPEYLDRYAAASHSSIIDLSILSLTMAELLTRLLTSRGKAKEENDNRITDNDNNSFNSGLSETHFEYTANHDKVWKHDLMKISSSLEKLIMEFLDECTNKIIYHNEKEYVIRFLNCTVISAPLASSIETLQSFIANSGPSQTNRQLRKRTKNDIVDDSIIVEDEFDEKSHTISYEDEELLDDPLKIMPGEISFAQVAEELYSSGIKFVGDKRLTIFPEISLSVGIAKIASVLPSNLAEILSRTNCNNNDPVSRTPFEIIRFVLEQLSKNEQLLNSNEGANYNCRPNSIHVSSLCKEMQAASEIFESCTKCARVVDDGVLYHSWHLATVFGLMCLKSGIKLGNGATLPNFGKPSIQSDDGGINNTIGEQYKAFLTHRAHASALFRAYVDLDKHFNETKGYEGNLTYFHLSVMSLLEWKEAILLLISNPSSDNDTFRKIRRMHAFHSIQWAILDGGSDSSLQRIISLWKSGEISYDAVLYLLASRLEKNPSSEDNWMVLACALIPFNCLTKQAQDMKQNRKPSWYENRKDFWEHHFFHINESSINNHHSIHVKLQEVLKDHAQKEITEFLFPFDLYFNDGLNITEQKKSIDASELHSLKQDSSDTIQSDDFIVEDRNFDELLPLHISESNQLNITTAEILFELGLEYSHTLSHVANMLRIVSYKIFIASYLYGLGHKYVEHFSLFLLNQVETHHGKLVKEQSVRICFIWMCKCGLNIFEKIKEVQQSNKNTDSEEEDLVEYLFSPILYE